MARLPTMAAAHGRERSTMPCLMAVTCTLSTTITVSTPRGVGLARVCGRFGCRIVFGRRVFPERGLPCVSCLSPDSRGASVYGLSCGCRLLCRPGLYFRFRLSLGSRTYRRGFRCREWRRRMPPRGSRQERQQQECI